ncbi:hypothetical protein L917_18925 [Phytophthora nicotianae]|uniref:Uncharacterized protein n=1 Tax=Phytophthora nicotianae TaxID=4792 RepID=W2K625_PHYNI|nr:hypothetical protein L917_18925 [Phytophthora nicotianae]
MRLPSASLRPCRQPPQPVRTSTASKLLVQSNNQLLMGLEHVRGLLLDWEADHVSRTPSSARRSVVAHRGSPDPAQQAELDTRTIVTHLPVCQLHQLQRPAQPSTSFVTRRPSGSTSQTPSTALPTRCSPCWKNESRVDSSLTIPVQEYYINLSMSYYVASRVH